MLDPDAEERQAGLGEDVAPTEIVASTIIGATRCGRRCERMIRESLAPTIRAASMNSFSRSDSTCARAMRAG